MLEAGTIFARDFRVVRPLRTGGMGAVFLVEQLSTGKPRALKLMSPALAGDRETRERFVLEAKVGSRIDSEHVVEVVTAGIDEGSGVPYLVMELLRGEDLADVLERLGPLPLGDVAEIFAQVGHALARAHAQGIVHRDLKPDNVFLSVARGRASMVEDTPYTVKILDFGVAKMTSGGGGATRPVGTPGYMAPEQTEAAGVVTPATDVWALGLLAFVTLTAGAFWRSADSGSLPKLLREMCVDPLLLASERARELGAAHRLPAGFDGWFARCVDRDPAARYQNAELAIDALLAIIPEWAECSVVVTDAGATSSASRARPRSGGGRAPRSTAEEGVRFSQHVELVLADDGAPATLELADPDFRRSSHPIGLAGSGGESAPPSQDGSLPRRPEASQPSMRPHRDPSLPAAHEVAGPLSDAPPAERSVRPWLLAAGAAVALVLLVVGAKRLASRAEAGPVAPSTTTTTSAAPAEQDAQAAAHAARSCETARYKVQSGGALGPDDAEGWVVEIFLARAGGAAPITLAPMSALMATARLPAELDAPLGARGGGLVTVIDGPSSPDPALQPGWPSVTVRLGGRYPAAYFDATTRSQVIAIAEHLAHAIDADAGVLYARCAHLSFLDATGWVRGRDPATAGAALLWTIATQPDSVGKNAPRLDLLRQQVARLDRSSVSAAVGSAGGTASTGQPAELRFPSAQPLAASNAARALAERLKKK